MLIHDTFVSTSDAAASSWQTICFHFPLGRIYISEEFPDVQIDAVGRRYWNHARGELSWIFLFRFSECFVGLEFVLQLCVDDDERAGTVLAVSNKQAILAFYVPPF